jgi:membrane-associated phospholipid phosphatase
VTVDVGPADDTGTDVPDDRSWLRSTGPVDRRQWLQLGIALVVCVGVFTAIGYVMTDLAAPNFITRYDEDLADRLASGRTPFQDDIAHWGAFIASTEVKIGLTALFAIAAIIVWRRWHDTVFLAFTLIFEATVFIVVTFFVARPRPDVPRLEDSPVDSSYPSGHVAAATVYGAFVVIVFWHTASKWWRSLAVALFVGVVGLVAWSRMYQGMHYLSDVVAGIVLGLVTLAICLTILGRPQTPPSDPPSASVPGA